MTSPNGNNETCLQYDHCGRLGDVETDFVDIDLEMSRTPSYNNYLHASHGMIFTRSHKVLWNTCQIRGSVLMQMRFDGVLGFPGGIIEKGEDPVAGLNREMEEEIGFEVNKHGFTAVDHLQTKVNEKKKLVLHFFTKEISEEDFRAIERNSLGAEEYGIETMGILRVPLYTMSDGLRGFPAFLANQFIGNTRRQLLDGLAYSQLLTAEEIKTAVQSCNNYLAQCCSKFKTD